MIHHNPLRQTLDIVFPAGRLHYGKCLARFGNDVSNVGAILGTQILEYNTLPVLYYGFRHVLSELQYNNALFRISSALWEKSSHIHLQKDRKKQQHSHTCRQWEMRETASVRFGGSFCFVTTSSPLELRSEEASDTLDVPSKL